MHPSVAPLLEIYKANANLFLHALADVSPEDIVRRPDNNVNSLHFVAGHMLNSRFVLGNLIGIEDKCPWPGLFARGAELKGISEYPGIEEIRDTWVALSEKLTGKLAELTESQLHTKVSARYPVDDDTVLGGIAFLALHDSYHVGQLGYVRKVLNYSRLAG